MRIISTLLVLFAMLFIVKAQVTSNLTRYCPPATDCSGKGSDPISFTVDKCMPYTDPCNNNLSGYAIVKTNATDVKSFGVNIFVGAQNCDGAATTTAQVVCGVCEPLQSLGFYQVDCPAEASSSSKDSNDSSASTLLASSVLLFGLVIAALL